MPKNRMVVDWSQMQIQAFTASAIQLIHDAISLLINREIEFMTNLLLNNRDVVFISHLQWLTTNIDRD